MVRDQACRDREVDLETEIPMPRAEGRKRNQYGIQVPNQREGRGPIQARVRGLLGAALAQPLPAGPGVCQYVASWWGVGSDRNPLNYIHWCINEEYIIIMLLKCRSWPLPLSLPSSISSLWYPWLRLSPCFSSHRGKYEKLESSGWSPIMVAALTASLMTGWMFLPLFSKLWISHRDLSSPQSGPHLP